MAVQLKYFGLAILVTFAIGKGFSQDVSFISSDLQGATISNPTSLQFGPDGRLYVSQQDGTIYAFTVVKNQSNSYSVVATETILLVKNIPNHNDDGSLNPAVADRQVTGILITGTATNPILYVTSSDPRIGGAGKGGDLNLDTNSGIVSKLTWNGSNWDKIDVVRGLPRSEENHAQNGMVIDTATNIMYLTSGGNTNAGSPSVNFAYLTEYALSAAILTIDLDRIEAEFGGMYDLPTLDDSTRVNNGPMGEDEGDPFGGNDGLNQAKIVVGGPVQIHSPGYRNAYDLVLTADGRLYTIDNGPNGGWGGYPEYESTDSVTNNYVPGEPGSDGPGANDDKVNNLDNLHLVSAPGFGPIYGGHPNPIRANPSGAGLYWFDNDLDTAFFGTPSLDWPPVPVSEANPVESDYRNPGVDDGSLAEFIASTNGMDEYTSTNVFGGAMTGDLIAASFDDEIFRIQLSADGQSVTNVEVLAANFGQTPLDLVAQGDGEIFEGTIWAVSYVSNTITIFEPEASEFWQQEESVDSSEPTARHESAYVEVGGKFYLFGGRGNKPVDIYDPIARVWTEGAMPPIEMHHFQAVAFNDKIYVLGGFTGDFPLETPLSNIYIYDPVLDTWSTSSAMPADRNRGSAGVVVHNDKIYLVCGIQNGHTDGWVTWLDQYDPVADTWTILADAPQARDHFHAAVLNDKLYAVAGRRSGELTTFTPTIPEVDVYDFATNTWSTLPAASNLPTERAGGSTVVFNNEVWVIGGETSGQPGDLAHADCEALDPGTNTWTTKPNLNTGRHGTQAIAFGGKIYIAGGSEKKGGGPETSSQEAFIATTICTGDPSFSLDDDNDGYTNGDEEANGTNPCSAASRPSDNDGDLVSDLLDDDDDNDTILDTADLFPLDADNGLTTDLPVDYPFLNGDPGFGLFGLGFTGLMNNGTDYLDLYDRTDPDLIMGGAVGLASLPANSGDATTNDQEYAFQFGVNVTSSTPIFTVQSKMLGNTFFDGAPLQDQSQGIYIGTGDQDNYLKIAVTAGGGAPGIQVLYEESGVVISDNTFPVTGITSEQVVELLLTVDPQNGTVQAKYFSTSNPTVTNAGAPVNLTGNLLSVVQGGTNAMSVGIIATSGSAAEFSATWDDMTVKALTPTVLNPIQDQVRVFNSGDFSIDISNVFDDDNGAGNLTYTIESVSNTVLISNADLTGTNLTLSFLDNELGASDITLRATDGDGMFVEDTFTVTLIDGYALKLNSGGDAFSYNGQVWEADNYASVSNTVEDTSIAIGNTDNDLLYQSFRQGNFTYDIPLPASGTYDITLHFADFISTLEGQSVFDMDLESGQGQLSEYDIVARSGGPSTAVQETFSDIYVDDGSLTITFSNVTNVARVSGVEIDIQGAVAQNGPLLASIGTQAMSEDSLLALTVTTSDISGEVPALSATGVPSFASFLDNGDGTGLFTASPLAGDAGIYVVTITATNPVSGLVDHEEFTLAVDDGTLYRINSAGTGFVHEMENWIGDRFQSGGGTVLKPSRTIAGTTNQELYRSNRHGNFNYKIPVTKSATYRVILHFADLQWSTAGERVFNVDIEAGQGQLNNFDIIAETGAANTALVKTFEDILVTDGVLNLSFIAVVHRALLSGIEIELIEETLPPVITNPGDREYQEGTPVSLQIEATDPNTGDILTYGATGLPAPLAIDPATGLISGTLEDDIGDYLVTITVSDTLNLQSEEMFTITIIPGPAPPVLASIDDQTLEELSSIDVPVSATDINNDPIGLTITSGPAFVSLEDLGGGSGTLTIAPQTGDDGTYQLTIRAEDDGGLFDETTITVLVTLGPRDPVLAAIADTSLVEETTLDLGISATDANGDPITLSIASGPPFASLTDAGEGTGTLTLAPQAGDEGDHLLTVRAEDDGGLFDEITITVTVIKAPTAPELAAIADPSVVEETTLDVAISATDANGDPITLSMASGPLFASLTDAGDGTGTLTLAPQAGDEGDHLLTVRAEDDDGLFDEITITVTVIKAPTAPELAAIADPSVVEETTLDVAISATDANGDPITLSITSGPTFASLTDAGDGTGTLTLAPQAGDEGDHLLTVRAEDDGGLFDEITITVTVIKAPTAPELAAIADPSLAEGETLDVAVSATDANDDPITLSIISGPDFAALIDFGDGTATLLLDPQPGDAGEYPLTIRAEDDGGLFDEITITVTVIIGPTAPEIASIDDPAVAEEATIDVAVSATDANGDPITLSVIAGPPFATLADHGDGTGTLTLAPETGDEGDYQLTLRAEDDGGLFTETTITITVIKGPAAPNLSMPGDPTVAEGSTEDINLSAIDPNGDPITLSIVAGPTFADLNDNGNGTGVITLSPQLGDEGTYQLTIRAEDDGGLFDEVMVTVTVIKGPTAPELDMINDQSLAEGSTVDVAVSVSDVNGDPITLSIISGPAFIDLDDQGNGEGTLTITPQAGDQGDYQLTIRAEDDGGLFDETTFTVTVTQGPVAPVLTSVSDQTVAEGANIEVGISATDANGDPITLSIISGPSFIDLNVQGNGEGTLTIAPQAGDEGDYQLTIRAEDDGGLFDETTITVSVILGQVAPVLSAMADQIIKEGDIEQVSISATDANGDPITLDIVSGPTFIDIDDHGNGTATLTLAPQVGDEGTYALTVRATDNGGLFDERVVAIEVLKGESAPEIAEIDDQDVLTGEAIEVSLSATDPHGDPITWTLVSGPSFASLSDFGNGRGVLILAPQAGDEGEYQITVRASDSDGEFSERTITVKITKGNTAPQLADINNQSLMEANSIEVAISASDDEDDPIVLTIASGPSLVSLIDNGNGTGQLIISPNFGDVGNYTITVQATDPGGLFTQESINLEVTETNQFPDWNVEATVTNTSCSGGDGSIDLEVTGGLGEVSYQWSNGAETEDINGLDPGTYQVDITDQKSNTITRSYVVNSDPGPPKPDIAWDGSVLQTTVEDVFYQWYFDGSAIDEAENNIYLPSESGTYKVTVTDDNGCSISSDEIFAEYEPMEVHIYPNPIQDYFKLELILAEAEEVTINLYNDRGRRFSLGSFELPAGRSLTELDIERLLIPDGLYTLRIISKQLPLQHHRVMIHK